jgi:carboxyl-terminal processing protease
VAKFSEKKVSVSLLILAVLFSFLAGNRLQSFGDYFFAPYANTKNQGLQENLDFTTTEKVFDLLKQKFDGELDMQALQDGLNRGLVQATGDSYTTYLSAKEAAEFADDLKGTFSGIGAELGKRDSKLTIITPLEGSPAQAAGVRAGDVVARINGEESIDLSVDAAVAKIRGEAGTEVTLTLLRGGETLEKKITRAQINVPSVKHEVLEGNIGYIQITRFGEDTADLARKAAVDLKSRQVKGIIVDVRNNGGGLLDSAVKIAGLWLDNKVVVEERVNGKTETALKTGTNPILADIPTKLLINEGSASASEILAGALHDHGVATLIGEKTFGKGSVQELIDLPDGAQLKITVAHWYTPNGVNVDKEGIKPDIEVGLSPEDFEQNRDPQKDRARQELQ